MLIQVTKCNYRLIQINLGYYSILQVTTGFWRLLQFKTDYSFTINWGSSFVEYLVSKNHEMPPSWCMTLVVEPNDAVKTFEMCPWQAGDANMTGLKDNYMYMQAETEK